MPPGAPVGRSTRHQRRFAAKSKIIAETVAETVALAEFLVPGVRVPIFDRATLPEETRALIHGFRARVLDLAYTQPETRELIDQITGGRFETASSMSREAVGLLFRAAAYAKARRDQSPVEAVRTPQ
jgi:hypothetical protein